MCLEVANLNRFIVLNLPWQKKKHEPCDLSRTACGIIPDSGTTLIAGSEKHIGELFEARSYSTEI